MYMISMLVKAKFGVSKHSHDFDLTLVVLYKFHTIVMAAKQVGYF